MRDVLQEKQDELGYQSFDIDANVGKVAVVGVGMKTHSGLAAKFFNALSDEGVNVLMISTSEIRIAALVPLEQLQDAVRALHTAYAWTPSRWKPWCMAVPVADVIARNINRKKTWLDCLRRLSQVFFYSHICFTDIFCR